MRLRTQIKYCKTRNFSSIKFSLISSSKSFCSFNFHCAMAVLFYIISRVNILATTNFHCLGLSAKIGKINRGWNFVVLQYYIWIMANILFVTSTCLETRKLINVQLLILHCSNPHSNGVISSLLVIACHCCVLWQHKWFHYMRETVDGAFLV